MLSYKLNKSTYTVTGIGDETQEKLIIPSTHEGLPVTKIAKNAFKKCNHIKQVVIGDNVREIEKYAFLDCPNLKRVTIGERVRKISGTAFWFCIELYTVYWNAVKCTQVHTIVEDKYDDINIELMFTGCEKLHTVIFGEKVELIPSYALFSCSHLKDVHIPKSVTKIERYALCACYHLKDITYSGTKLEWQSINIDPKWDEYARDYTIHCTDGDMQ